MKFDVLGKKKKKRVGGKDLLHILYLICKEYEVFNPEQECAGREVYWPSDEAERVEFLAFCGLLLLLKKTKQTKPEMMFLGCWNEMLIGLEHR